MEKLLKLEACSSLSQSKGRFVESSDKISNLPIHIAHHVHPLISYDGRYCTIEHGVQVVAKIMHIYSFLDP
jgi:hypothetical protein